MRSRRRGRRSRGEGQGGLEQARGEQARGDEEQGRGRGPRGAGQGGVTLLESSSPAIWLTASDSASRAITAQHGQGEGHRQKRGELEKGHRHERGN